MSATATAEWIDAIATLEEIVRRQSDFVERGELPPEHEWRAPAGPPPDELRPRLAIAFARTVEMEERLHDRLWSFIPATRSPYR